MTQNSDDLALDTLVGVREDMALNLDEQLVRSCYAIQKKHQFEQDRSASMQAMERLIDEYVDAVMSMGSEANESA